MEQLNASRMLDLEGKQNGVEHQIMNLCRYGARILFLAILTAVSTLPFAFAGGLPQTPPSDDETDMQAATAEMERLYDQILNRFKNDEVFIAKMRSAQSAWQRFKDAHLEALYPAKDKRLAYGSAYSQCRQTAMAVLTRQRIEQLRPWLVGVAEGDVCAGSLPSH